jgi:hypothetical protein
LNLPPAAKGYILCALQHNLNKDEETKQPIEMNTLTTYNVSELSKLYNMPVSSVYKIEKLLKDKGILTIEQDPNQKRDQETGLVIQNRSVGLKELGLDVYVLEALAEHEERIQKVESKILSKEDIRKIAEEEFKRLYLDKFAKEVEFKKED